MKDSDTNNLNGRNDWGPKHFRNQSDRSKGSTGDDKIFEALGVKKAGTGYVPPALQEGGVGTPRYLHENADDSSPMPTGMTRPTKSPN